LLINLRRIVRASKSEIAIGKWHNGKVPKSEFPIGKTSYRLGNAFQWCVIKFTALSIEFKVLVVMNPSKEKFQAILGAPDSSSIRILCTYEYHADEPGWHCHAACDEIAKVPLGYARGPWVRRIPGAKRTHNRQAFTICDEKSAQRAALKYYGIEEEGSLL